jgi:hypothetical protein
MKFLIDTRDGRTITAHLADCSQSYPFVDRIDVDMDAETTLPCVLSTARSLEAEALKEATAIIQKLMDKEGWSIAAEWLAKWGQD